jgi:RimJ/RimL family protein N-acetyltransferase
MEALVEGDDAFSARFGIPVVTGWAGFPEALPHALDGVRANGSSAWGSHLFFDDDGALVGFGGWKGEPVDGAAELGYAVAPERQERGIATAVVRELLARGRAAGLRLAVAHTLPETSPSTAVLTRCGFSHVGATDGANEGVVWRWELPLDRVDARRAVSTGATSRTVGSSPDGPA